MVASSRYAFDGVIGISTPYGLLQGWQARLLHPGLLKFASLFLPEINKPALSDNPEEVDERDPKIDLDPYPRYVTRALVEVLELVKEPLRFVVDSPHLKCGYDLDLNNEE